MAPKQPLSPAAALQAACASVIEDAKKLHLDEEDYDDLQRFISDHVEGLRVRREENVGGFASVTVLSCPFYMDAELSKRANFTSDCEASGELLLAGGLIESEGAATIALSPRQKVLLTDGQNNRGKAWQWWREQGGVRQSAHANSLCDIEDVASLLPPAEDMARAWASSAMPAIRFAVRFSDPRKNRGFLSRAQETLAAGVEPVMRQHKQSLEGELQGLLDPELVSALKRDGVPRTLGAYNFLGRTSEKGRDPEISRRNRLQSFDATPLIVPLLCDFHTPGPSANRYRDAVDSSSKLLDVVGSSFEPDERLVLKKMLKRSPAAFGVDPRRVNLAWIRDFVTLQAQFPPARRPANEDDYSIAQSLSRAAEPISDLAEATGQTPQALWDGLLKQGWQQGPRSLVGHLLHEVPQEQTAISHFAIEVLENLRMMPPRLRGALETLEVTPSKAAQAVEVLLSDRSLLRLAETVRPWNEAYLAYETTLQDGASLPDSTGVPRGCDWTPLLRDGTFIVGDVTFEEITTQSGLVAEGTFQNHCVGGYLYRCQTRGARIFKAVHKSNEQRDHRGTLHLDVSLKDLTVREAQFTCLRNGSVAEPLRMAAQHLINGLNHEEIPSDRDGARRDAVIFQGRESRGYFEDQRRAEAQELLRMREAAHELSRAVSFLMPRACRGMTLLEFANSDFVAAQVAERSSREQAQKARDALAGIKLEPAHQDSGFGFGA